MNAWDILRRVASDNKSGAADLARRTGSALLDLDNRKDVMRAARRLLRVHQAMGPMWRVFALALTDRSELERFTGQLEDESDLVARAAAGWAFPNKAAVITHSWSSTVFESLAKGGPSRVDSIMCTASLPGGEGRAMAAKLRRAGFDARVVHDAEISRAASESSIALCGADAVTETSVVNKVGTSLIALACREHGVPCYVLAGSSKMVPSRVLGQSRLFEATPVDLFDAIICERGPLRPAQARKMAAKIEIPKALLSLGRAGVRGVEKRRHS